MLKIIIFNGSKGLNAIDNPSKSNKDSLITHLSKIAEVPTFDPIQNDWSSSGSIRLIRNKKLKRALSSWPLDIIAIKEMENLWTEVMKLKMIPICIILGISRDLEKDYWCIKNTEKSYLLDKNSYVKEVTIGKAKFGVSSTEITSSRIIASLARLAVSLNRITNLQSKALRDRIIEIINLIDREIN